MNPKKSPSTLPKKPTWNQTSTIATRAQKKLIIQPGGKQNALVSQQVPATYAAPEPETVPKNDDMQRNANKEIMQSYSSSSSNEDGDKKKLHAITLKQSMEEGNDSKDALKKASLVSGFSLVDSVESNADPPFKQVSPGEEVLKNKP